MAYSFIDIRQPPIGAEQVATWYAALGDALVNTRSTSYRQLSQAERTQIADGDSLAVLQRYPTLIKRPVLQLGQDYFADFQPLVINLFFLKIN